MIRLEPMSQDAWDERMRTELPRYAEDQTKTGNWSQINALEKAREQFETLLPDGIKTVDHHMHHLIEESTGKIVGYLWFQERTEYPLPYTFLCHLFVDEPHRRKGIATAALKAMDRFVQRRGMGKIQLHVFGHNSGARALHRKLGYEETNVIMTKRLIDGPVA